MGRSRMGMPPKQQLFVQEYLIDFDGAKAVRRAGYADRQPNKLAHQLLGKPEVMEAIQKAMNERIERTKITADDVLRNLAAIAQADVRELIEFRRTCCRYCWGKGFRYQRTAGEIEREREEFQALPDKLKKGKTFDLKGGDGYNAKRDPNPQCPECFGDGVGDAFVHDTRRISPDAARLYAGVKVTREGLEVKTHSAIDALVKIGHHLGMFKDKIEHSGPDGKPLQAAAPVFNVTVKG